MVKLALAQIRVAYNDKSSNLKRVLSAIDVAGKKKADVIVFPECCDVGWANPNAARLAEPVEGAFVGTVVDAANQNQVNVVLGFSERTQDHTHNACAFITKNGKIAATYHKISELGFARKIYAAGNTITTFKWLDKTVGLTICHDNFTPSVIDQYHQKKTQLIFSPCAWAIEKGGEDKNLEDIQRWLKESTVNKNLAFVCANAVGAITEGAWNGKILQGNSLVMGPDGKLLAKMGRKEELKIVDIAPNAIFSRGT